MREFSEESRQHFYDIIDEVNDSDWCAFTDWFGDRFSDIGSCFGYLDVDNYLDDMETYWTRVVDNNNTEKSEIDGIFEDVQGVDEDYESKFSQYIQIVTGQLKLITSLNEIMAPGKGNYTVDNINEKVGASSIELIDAYVNMAEKNGKDGKYDFDYIYSFFDRKPDTVSEYEYYAMIAVFNNMENSDKEKFIESAYRKTGEFIFDNEDSCFGGSGVWKSELSETYKKMVEYYEYNVCHIDEESLNKNSQNYDNTMAYINNYSMLSIFTDISPEIYTTGVHTIFNLVDMYTPVDITITEEEKVDTCDYKIKINGSDTFQSSSGLGKRTSTGEEKTYTVYSLSDSDWAIDEAVKNSLEQLKTDPVEGAIVNGASWAYGIALGYMNLSGGQNLILSTPIAIATGTDAWYATVDTNEELEDDQKKLTYGNILSGLCTKSTVIVGDDGTCAITKAYVDKEMLGKRIEEYNELCDDSKKLNITPEEIEKLLHKEKGLDGIDNLDSFIEWSCRYSD